MTIDIKTITVLAGLASAATGVLAEPAPIDDDIYIEVGVGESDWTTPTDFFINIFVRAASDTETGLFGQSPPFVEFIDLLNDPGGKVQVLIGEDYHCGSGSSNGDELYINGDTSSAAFDPNSVGNLIILDTELDNSTSCDNASLKHLIIQHTRQYAEFVDRGDNGVSIGACIRMEAEPGYDSCGGSTPNPSTPSERIVSYAGVILRNGSYSATPDYIGEYTRSTFSADGGFWVEGTVGIPSLPTDPWHIFNEGTGYVADIYNIHFSDEMLDLTGDGRFSHADLTELEAMIAASSYDANFDFNGDSSLDAEWDAIVLETLLDAGLSAGLLGDADQDGVVGCSDISVAASHTYGSTVLAGTAGYKIELDADLDGDNDADDRAAVELALLAVEPANFVLDNVLNYIDVSEFTARYSAMDPSADLNGDGVFNYFDLEEFLRNFNSPICLDDPTP